MNIKELINQIKIHPEYDKVGMVLYHNGVVRKTSRDGSKVKGLLVEVNYDLLDKVIYDNKKKPGIIEILVKIDDNKRLSVGEDVMFIAVAGDIRENVFPVLIDTLNTIKSTVTKKSEFFI